MTYRTSVHGLLAVVAVLVNGLPLNATTPATNSSMECVNDGTIQALQASLDSAETFCSSFANYVKPRPAAEVTEAITSTFMVGSATVTSIVISTPTMVMTVMEDYVQFVTTTLTQAACNATTTRPLQAIQIPSTSSGSGSGSIPPPRGGVFHGGKRDQQLPAYVAQYALNQVSSACGCLQSSQAAVTATVTQVMATETGTTDTMTATHTTVLSPPIVSYVHLGATHTQLVTACATGSPVIAAFK